MHRAAAPSRLDRPVMSVFRSAAAFLHPYEMRAATGLENLRGRFCRKQAGNSEKIFRGFPNENARKKSALKIHLLNSMLKYRSEPQVR
jgi:hypothetical protein